MTRRLPGLSPALVQRLAKREDQHKYDHGHVLVISGGVGRGGATRLAARGALRVGAGLVTVGAPSDAIPEHAAQLNAIMLRPLNDGEDLAGLLDDPRLNALCLGPGLGLGDRTRSLVRTALSAGRATVLDADALTAFAAGAGTLFSMLHGNVVITPHEGEFARLFPDLAKSMRVSARSDAARLAVEQAARRSGSTVLLKGSLTRIATPSGLMAEVALTGDHAAPWLATAGSGDVLAGVIAGLLARGFSPMQAAETGAGLHASAGRIVGPGLIAEDLPEAMPDVFRSLGL